MIAISRWLIVLSTFFLVPVALAQPDPVEGVLTPAELQLVDSLESQRTGLNQRMGELRTRFESAGSNFEKLLETSKPEVLAFSDAYYDYKVDRLYFMNGLAYRLAKEIAAKSGLNNPTFAEIEATFAKIQAATPQVKKLSKFDPSSKEYQRAKEESAAAFDAINPAHRTLVALCAKYAEEVKQAGKVGLVAKLWRYFSNLLQPFKEAVGSFQDKALKSFLASKRSIFKPVELLFNELYRVRGYEMSADLTLGLDRQLKPGQLNVIIPPHGSPEEVAMTAARIANALPPGRKAAIVLAAYHFVPGTEKGFELANLIANHPDFIAVLAETSQFADRAKTERVDIQIKNAMDRGVTDIIIFAEGRNTSRDGGFTSANQNTMRLLRLLPRQTVTVGGEEKRIEPVVTMVSALFPNHQFGLGVGRDPLYIGVEQFFDAERTQALAKDAPALAALFDVAWNLRATSLSPNRIGSSAPETEILKDIAGPLLETVQGCSMLGEMSAMNAVMKGALPN